MPNAYGQMTKIPNARGRSAYISDSEQQEEIVLHESDMTYDWSFYHEYEKNHAVKGQTNNEAREIIVALPNELYEEPEKLKSVCDDLTKGIIQGNNDYEYAVHWNHNRTNLHMHLLFSEREKVTEREPKTYKKDVWHDKDTHKLAKANAENAILVHRKGEVQKDKDGNVKYNDEPLTAKNVRFKTYAFSQDINPIISQVMERYGFDLAVQDKTTPYLSQRKLHKGWKEDYLENAREYNKAVRGYNKAVKEHIEIEPDQKDVYVAFRNQIESAVKGENRPEKKLTLRAVGIIRDMRDTIRETVNALKVSLSAQNKVERLMDWYRGHKRQFDAEFGEIDKLRHVQIVGKTAVATKMKVADSKKAVWDEAKNQENAAKAAVKTIERQMEIERRKEAQLKNGVSPERKSVKQRLEEARQKAELYEPKKKKPRDRGGWER